MEFSKANKADIDGIMNIIKGAQENFKIQGIDQWQNNYPNYQVIEEDIVNNNSYVLKYEGAVIATTFLSFEGEETYETIYGGNWLSHGEYGVIHRMAIDFDYRGTGLSYIFLKALEQLCIDREIYSIKVDTHRENIAMKKLLLKNSYQECGFIYLKDGDQRIAFEKLLKI